MVFFFSEFMCNNKQKRKEEVTSDETPKKKKPLVEENIICCGIKFSTKSEKQQHILKNQKCVQTCFMCLKSFSSKQNLDQHFEKVSDIWLEWNLFLKGFQFYNFLKRFAHQE